MMTNFAKSTFMRGLQSVRNHSLKSLIVLSLLWTCAQVTFAATADGTWTGAPFKLEVKQAGNAVSGKVQLGTGSFDIKDGRSTPDGNMLSFTATQNVRVVDAAKTEDLPKQQKFFYRAIVNGDKLRLTVTPADGKGAPQSFDLERSK